MEPDAPAPADAECLPDHVYANWLALAVRVAAEAPDRAEWQRWANERIRPALAASREACATSCTPARATSCTPARARRIGYMEEAEPHAHAARTRAP